MSTQMPSIKKNYLMNLSYQIVAILVPLVTTPYVSRILNADGIGAYSYTLSVTTYFSLFATLGVSTYGQLKIAKCRDNKVERSKTFWEIMIARLFTTSLVAVIYFILEPILGIYKNLYVLMAINLMAGAFDLSWFFQGLELFKLTVSRNFFIRLISTFCIFAFVKEKSDLVIYTFILQGSTLLGNILLWPYLKKYLCKVEFRSFVFVEHWKQSIIYFIPTIATSVYTILDKSMIGWLTNSAFQNGYYEQAHKIEQILVLVVTSLGTVTLPRMVYLIQDGNTKTYQKIMNSTLNFIFAISVPMCIGVLVIAPTLIPLFLGKGYEPCIKLLQVFSFLIIIVGLDNIIGKQCLMATNKQRQFNIGVIMGAVVNFFVNIILIPRLGAIGAAIGSVAAEFVILSLFIWFSKEMLDFKFIFRIFIRYLVTSIIMSLVVIIIGKVTNASIMMMAIQIFLGICVYILLLLLIRDRFTLDIIKSFVGKIVFKVNKK